MESMIAARLALRGLREANRGRFSIRGISRTLIGSALVAIACSAAALATVGATAASGSALTTRGSVAGVEVLRHSSNSGATRTADEGITAELAHLHETTGIGLGAILAIENVLRDDQVTVSANVRSTRTTTSGITAELAHLHETTGIGLGAILAIENVLRAFSG
jgi:hypothetical protein